eukprot:GHVN01066721.1.p1 GENE.GHVN01066721.1~~GHVN01066721.1.p1  ORF type:complete len:147 (+),score=20.83 GHVN01066721.1:369-809(+)
MAAALFLFQLTGGSRDLFLNFASLVNLLGFFIYWDIGRGRDKTSMLMPLMKGAKKLSQWQIVAGTGDYGRNGGSKYSPLPEERIAHQFTSHLVQSPSLQTRDELTSLPSYRQASGVRVSSSLDFKLSSPIRSGERFIPSDSMPTIG